MKQVIIKYEGNLSISEELKFTYEMKKVRILGFNKTINEMSEALGMERDAYIRMESGSMAINDIVRQLWYFRKMQNYLPKNKYNGLIDDYGCQYILSDILIERHFEECGVMDIELRLDPMVFENTFKQLGKINYKQLVESLIATKPDRVFIADKNNIGLEIHSTGFDPFFIPYSLLGLFKSVKSDLSDLESDKSDFNGFEADKSDLSDLESDLSKQNLEFTSFKQSNT